MPIQQGVDNALDRIFGKAVTEKLSAIGEPEQLNPRFTGGGKPLPAEARPQSPLPPPREEVPPPPPPPPRKVAAPELEYFIRDYAKKKGVELYPKQEWLITTKEGREARFRAAEIRKEATNEYQKLHGVSETFRQVTSEYGRILFQPLKAITASGREKWEGWDWLYSALDVIPGLGAGVAGAVKSSKIAKAGGKVASATDILAGLAGEAGKAKKGQAASAGAAKLAKAGNIRLEKFPEEAQGLIKEFLAENPQQVAVSRRGVIPDAQVKEMSVKVIEKWGGDSTKVLKNWKPGFSWNAEETMALDTILATKAKQIRELATVIDKGADSIENTVKLAQQNQEFGALWEAVMGSRAETGRALRQFRQNREALAVAIDSKNAQKIQDVLDILGGRAKQKEIAKALLKLDWDNPRAISAFLRSVLNINLMDKITYIFINSLVANPATQLVNMGSNMFNGLLSPIERFAAAGAEVPWAMLTGRPRARFFGEAFAEVFGILRGIPEGTKKALYVLKTGESLGATKWEIPRIPPIGGVSGRIIGAGTTGLEAADAFFYGINNSMALRSQAYRLAARKGLKGNAFAREIANLIENPTKELIDAASKIAEERLFRQQLKGLGKAVMSVREMDIKGFKPMRFVIPFVRTPINIEKYGLQRSPLGVLNPDMWNNFFKKSPEFADNVARWVMGSAFAASIAIYVGDDKITGAPPRNPAERDRFYREGKQPYSFKIGDTWINYNRAEPFNAPFIFIAAIVEAIKAQEPEDKINDLVLRAISHIGRNMIDKPYFSGIGNVYNAIEDPERYGGTFINRLAVGFMPFSALSRSVERQISPEIEEPENFIDAMEANIPLLSERIPKKVTALGETVVRQGSPFLPIQVSTEKHSKLNDELERLGVNLGFVGDAIWGIEMDAKEALEYQKRAGQLVKFAIENEIGTETYRKGGADWQVKQLQSVADDAREEARMEMLRKFHDDGRLKGDMRLVFEYDTARMKLPEELRSKVGIQWRKQNPELDAALNMTGRATTVQSGAALKILIRKAQEAGIPPEMFPALRNLGIR